MSKKIYISPSDQNKNIYATGNTNEMVQCQKIGRALAKALERCGFEAKSNDTDEMEERVSESNAWGADMHICIHTNAFNGYVKGTRIFSYDTSGEGYQACRQIMATLSPITPGESDNITPYPGLYEVRNTEAPTVYIEVAFHDNKEEAAWIIAHTDDIAEAICKGVCNHYGVKYAEKPSVNTSSGTWFRVQCGAFRKLQNAERLRDELRSKGYSDAFIVEVSK
jgi:N-acetylmuramoyl-L-alanine amidase